DNSELKTAGRALGQALRALHDAGLMQKDAHLGNFLYREASVCVIDGAAIVSSGPLLRSWRQLQNLALVLAQLSVYHGGFAEAVLSGYGSRFSPPQVSRALQRQRGRRERKYMRKTLRNCSEFKATHQFRLRRIVRRDQQEDQGLQALLADLDGAIAAGEPLKLGNSATLVKIRPADRWLVIKRYNIKSPWHRLKRLLRVTRAARSWQNGYRLSMWGLATPLPLALVEHRFGPLKGKSYLICEYSSLVDCGEYPQSQPGENGEEQTLIRALGTTVAALKILGVSHGDLKASNLKFNGNFLQLLDLDSVTRWRSKRRLEQAIQRDCQRLLRNWEDAPQFVQQLAHGLEAHLIRPGELTGFINP
ncbi:MAG: lipopolysaccharide kinase InaA family protein, partial [Gammaproteobacteria bacterium]